MRVFFAVLFLSILLYGCLEPIMAMKRLGDSQQEMQDYVDQKEGLFIRLKDAVNNGGLRQGLSKEEVISLYGEPVLCKDHSDGDFFGSKCLYRRPVKYFSTDFIYLVFDKDGLLCSWELKPVP